MQDWIEELLSKYTYNPKAGKQLSPTLTVYKGVQRETNQAVAIKIIKSPQPELFTYLQRLKEIKSDYIIRITDVVMNSQTAVLICEDAPYGSLATALAKCRRLQDTDAIFMAKSLINGYIDILKGEASWSGGLADVEITDSGVKLSWNGSVVSQQNPFPELIQKISWRDPAEEKGILPFPKNRQILELIQVCKQSVTEMSIHPLIKKRDRVFKKKGKGWLAIKESKHRGEYFDETIFLAVSPSHGFVRVKMYEKGKIEKDEMFLNKTKSSFVKVLDEYDEGSSTFIVSEYANDGNLQQYVAKLKGSNVQLKEDQIQFFLYSVVEPIKAIQQSPLLSVNSLHIRNIWVEDGIPKIGEPVPMTGKILKILKDRYQVPDFYHRVYKNNPSSHDPSYDTYSLGVLLYKLMYGQYPIFPEGKVHIPIAPPYNNRIKTTLRIFLDEGGKIGDIESKLEMTDIVKKQIRVNNMKLDPKSKNYLDEIESIQNINQVQGTSQQPNSEFKVKQQTCWQKLTEPLKQSKQGRKTSSFFIDCQVSRLKNFRICTKILLALILYIFIFFFWYLNKVFDMFIKTSNYEAFNISILITNYTVTTSQSLNLMTDFNASTRDSSAIVNTLKCAVDTTNTPYSSYVSPSSAGWVIYLSISLLFFAMFILFKVFQIGWFDMVRTAFNYQTRRYNFNISTYIIFNLTFCLGLYSFYFMFQYIFDAQMSPCFGGDQSLWYTSTIALLTDRDYLMARIFPALLVILILVILSFVQIIKHQKIKYSLIVNPLSLLCPVLIILTLVTRVGVLSSFTPSWINSSIFISQVQNGSFSAVIGTIPQILLLIELALGLLVDFIFWKCQKNRQKMLVHDQSMSEEFRDPNV